IDEVIQMGVVQLARRKFEECNGPGSSAGPVDLWKKMTLSVEDGGSYLIQLARYLIKTERPKDLGRHPALIEQALSVLLMLLRAECEEKKKKENKKKMERDITYDFGGGGESGNAF